MTESFDLVVVGSGGGALTGAALAARAGLATVVLEATDRVGGTSAYSGGACWLPGSDVQQRAGLPDSTDSARAYLAALLHGSDPARVSAFLDGAPVLVAELEDAGLPFEWLPFPEYFDAPGRVPSGRSIQPAAVGRADLPPAVAELVRPPVERDRAGRGGRNTLTGGQALIARLLALFVEHGGTLRTGARVTGLTVDGGRVTGVTTDDGTAVAGRAVLLACGGFEGDQVLRDVHGVPGRTAWSMAPRGANRGELLRAAASAGAATALLDQAWLCPGLLQPDGGGSFTLGFRGGLMVDATGRRYANESLPYDRFGREMAGGPDRIPSWYVFDGREGGGFPAIAMPEGDPAAHLAAGTWVRTGTLADLAEAIRTPHLLETVERFNGFAEKGVDEDFGRGDDEYDTFFTGGPALGAVTEPPFTAARFVLSDLGTKGGLVTDADARVLTAGGEPIPGMFAAGNTAANLAGPVYPAPGVPLGTAMVAAHRAVLALTGS